MKKMKKKLEVEYSCYSEDDVLKVDDDNHDGGRDERWKMSGTK